MTAYYNENDPFAVEWLKNLIAAGHIANGVVDDRSILDVKPEELTDFTQCHFFAGIGVWSFALRLAGWPDDRPVWTGSCPCQPFSTAGKGDGFDDERHLWPYWFHHICECRPGEIFGEQVAGKDGLAWLDLVQADLEAANYAVGAADMCAAGVGAPHWRQRLWIYGQSEGMADTTRGRFTGAGGRSEAQGQRTTECSMPRELGRVADAERPRETNGFWRNADWLFCRDGKWRPVEPATFPLAHGATARVGRLRAYGNAIVPQVAAQFIEATQGW